MCKREGEWACVGGRERVTMNVRVHERVILRVSKTIKVITTTKDQGAIECICMWVCASPGHRGQTQSLYQDSSHHHPHPHLTQDRDNYIGDDAFKPFNHYSADFNVRLHEETVAYSSEKCHRMQDYFTQHIDFFHDRGYNSYRDPRLLPLRFPVAQLIETMPRQQLLKEIQQQQLVTKVIIEWEQLEL